MNLESWQAGLILGSAFSLVVEHAVRAALWRLRVRKRKQCTHCTGILGDDGRAEFPVERLECCAWCGDTWEVGKRPEYVGPGYRESAGAPLPTPKKLVPWPHKPQGPDITLEVEGRPVPGPGMNRLGMSAFAVPDIDEHGALTANGLRKVLDDPQSASPPRRRRGR